MAGERSVHRTPDFDRIVALPSRAPTIEAGEAASELLTPMLTTPLGKRRGARLRPFQALVIQEALELGGVFAGLPVGEGKTLPTYVLPYCFEALRPLLILPGKLVDDTFTKFAGYAENWVGRVPTIMSFEKFQDDGFFDVLEQMMPDLILIDEVHKLKNQKRAITKRIDRYQAMSLERREELCRKRPGGRVPMFDLKICSFSASPYDQTIQDCSHFMVWALGTRAPVPLNFAELNHWGDALNVPNPRVGQRPGVGVLVDLAPGVEGTTRLQRARRAFGHRVRHTPGVVIADSSACDMPLEIKFECPPEDPILNEVFDVWRTKFELPDGQRASDVFSMLRWEDELGCGFWQKLVPPPPLEWRQARWAVCDFIRDQIEKTDRARRPLDTEAAVLRAHGDNPIVQAWKAVKHLGDDCVSTPTWITASVVDHCAAWLREHRGVVATLNPVFGRAVAAAAGVRYYGAQGLADDGTFIEREVPGRGAVFSIKANGEGRNLQDLWHEMLVVGCERQANAVEQTWGRIHRAGQKRPCTVTVLCTSGGTVLNYRKAVSTALDFASELTEHQNKILTCPIPRVIYPSTALRWA